VLPHGPGPFRVENGVTRVYVNRWKAWPSSSFCRCSAFSFLVLAFTSGGAPWEVWVAIPLCAAVPAVLLWRYGPRRLFDRDAALLIDAHGLRDSVKGIDVAWDEVERLVPREQVLSGGATQRWLGIAPRDDGVLERQSRSVQLAARLDDFAHAAAPPMNVQLNLLGTTTDELVAQIRRYWDGPIDGYPLERTSAPDFGVRQSRVHRFLVWASGWAVAIAIGGGIVALAIWLGLA
jgi:hypothetical protein